MKIPSYCIKSVLVMCNNIEVVVIMSRSFALQHSYCEYKSFAFQNAYHFYSVLKIALWHGQKPVVQSYLSCNLD